jgi:hypothetical protein
MNSSSSSSVSQSTSSTEPDGLHGSSGAGRAVGFGFHGGEEGGLRLGGGSVEGRAGETGRAAPTAVRSGGGGGTRPVALSRFSNGNIPLETYVIILKLRHVAFGLSPHFISTSHLYVSWRSVGDKLKWLRYGSHCSHGNKPDVHANIRDFIGLGGMGKICLRFSQKIGAQIRIGAMTLANEMSGDATNIQSQ